MIAFSYPVGVIPQQELKEFRKKDGEVFYNLEGTFDDVPMNVIISSYVWRNEFFGKVKLTACPYAYKDEDKSYVTAWYAHNAEIVDEDEPENNTIQCQLKVTKMEPLSLSRNAVDILKFIGTQISVNRQVVVLYCIAKDAAARKLSQLKVGDMFTETGRFAMHRGYRNVIIEELETTQKDSNEEKESD